MNYFEVNLIKIFFFFTNLYIVMKMMVSYVVHYGNSRGISGSVNLCVSCILFTRILFLILLNFKICCLKYFVCNVSSNLIVLIKLVVKN